MSVKRIWHGWTTPENANTYQEFVTIMTFDSLKNVKDFQGKDYEK